MNFEKPEIRPKDGRFSPGPSRKRPGWNPDILKGALLGRSHRSAPAKAQLKYLIDLTREVLEVPADYHIGITAASDTGAVEMAMWNILGSRGCDVAAWENFGNDWITDAKTQLPLSDLRILQADYGHLPDLSQYSGDRDLVFTWNGTTAGVKVPNADFIPTDRTGITICDATSAAFAQPLDWEKLDVTTYSWQKNMGGEAAHGMIIMSPRALEHIEAYDPPWPLPKIFRLKKGGKVNAAFFEGNVINTVSMMCVEDHIDTLEWVKARGGLQMMHDRADENAQILWDWIDRTPWISNLCQEADDCRSNTGVCMAITDPKVAALGADARSKFAKDIVSLLDSEGVAHDFGSYRTAPPGFRIWASGLAAKSDIEAVLPWLEWGFKTVAARTL